MTTVGPDKEPAVVMEPGEAALDDPAVASEAGPVHGLATGDHGFDTAPPDEPAVLVVVVATIGEQPLGSASRPTDAAAHRRHQVEQLEQRGDVITVATGERPCAPEPAPLHAEGVRARAPPAVTGAGTHFRAPFSACPCLESATARDQSTSPAACSSASNAACSRSHTPACCQSRNRRHAVIPQPKPSSCGRCSQP